MKDKDQVNIQAELVFEITFEIVEKSGRRKSRFPELGTKFTGMVL